ncbi:hypothetical protein QE152_g29995 [Popillia japonica]|uniref:Uncharacterized protein n=1 Tax=Popillia japonica TaxID=7064 RepID=A0AAW1JFM5_POPJA
MYLVQHIPNFNDNHNHMLNQFRNNVPRPTYSQFQRQPQPHAKPSSFKFAKTSAQQLEKRQPRQQPMDIDPSLSRMRQQTPFDRHHGIHQEM